ncbi:PepSY domain-containing protein [Sutcliffiella halmapala]|uniref:PepSY domain-containing protein n=1 Tax=Sutcliffiella halmapala TaxID=79882 RepID=UPI000994A1CC|nr:PepSY domain-containing protein [Sutcliffiella halmapala]
MKLFTAVLAGAVLIGGVSVGAEALKKNDPEKNLQQVQNIEPPSDEANTGITLSEAADIALGKVENGVVTDAEKDRENGRLVFEIEVKDDEFEYDFKIDQQNGDIIKEKKKARKGKKYRNDTSLSPSNEALISIAKAKDVALKEVQGIVDDIELERENGAYVYEVEIEPENQGTDDDDVTVYVDAVTGKVLYVEWDD